MSAVKMLLILAAIGVGAAFVPLKTLECPYWDVWVTDQSDRPVAGITVRLSYRNYSAEHESHEIDEITDAKGHVKFNSRSITASVGRRIAVILSSAQAGVHASFGPHAYVFAFGHGLEGSDVDNSKGVLVDWTGKTDHMQSRIVVSPQMMQ
jgi:hypothetical protein